MEINDEGYDLKKYQKKWLENFILKRDTGLGKKTED